jgi:hypothetical protein
MKKIIFIVFAVLTAVTTFAQKDKLNKPDSAASIKLKYSCPMHPEVTSDKPGKCTKCGMELALSKKEQMKTGVTAKYSCPMHSDVVSDKAGKCPKCGMELAKSKKEQMKMYSCPMHPGETSDKAGKCTKCGMDLVKTKIKKG